MQAKTDKHNTIQNNLATVLSENKFSFGHLVSNLNTEWTENARLETKFEIEIAKHYNTSLNIYLNRYHTLNESVCFMSV